LSEVNLLGKKENTPSSSAPGFDSVGQILKYYRELKGLSLEEVSKRTYIKLKYLDSLEENHQDIMPAPVYVYSYIKHYAKLLGLEGAELVKLYQKQCNLVDNEIDNNTLKISPVSENVASRETYGSQPDISVVQTPSPRLQKNPGDIQGNSNLNKNTTASLKPEIKNDNIYIQNKNIIELNSKDINKDNGKTLMDIDAILDNNMVSKPATPPVKQEIPVAAPKIEQEMPKPEEKIITQEMINATLDADRIIRDARREAERIIQDAQEEAYELRSGAQSYADSVLKSLEQELTISLNEIKNGRAYLVSKNLSELIGEAQSQ
jgi:cell division septum initiation protein DivIVA/transcriptional regulator with XRE-family HTH domain